MLRSRAFLRTQNPIASSWLTLLGESERDLPIAGIEQYVVKLSVPVAAKSGSYTFRLDMVDVTNPDDSLTQGPTVMFTVPPVKKEKPRYRIWIPLVILGMIILLAIAYIAFRVITGQ